MPNVGRYVEKVGVFLFSCDSFLAGLVKKSGSYKRKLQKCHFLGSMSHTEVTVDLVPMPVFKAGNGFDIFFKSDILLPMLEE